MNTSQTLTIVAIVAVALAAVNLIVTAEKVGSLTGYASSDQGNATLIVQSTVDLTFTTDLVNWSSGSVNTTCINAFLDTEGHRGPVDTQGGQCAVGWTTNNIGLILENTGNINASVTLTSNKDATAFIGGSNPAFMWKVTQNAGGEAGTCTTGLGPGSYASVTTSATTICTNMGNNQYFPTHNALRIDLNVTVPSDSYNAAGGPVKEAVLTASGTAI